MRLKFLAAAKISLAGLIVLLVMLPRARAAGQDVAPASARNAAGITSHSILGIKLGMARSQVMALLPKAPCCDRLEGNGVTERLVARTHRIEVYFSSGQTGVVIVTTWNPVLLTDRGIGPCSPVSALKQAYGQRLKPLRPFGSKIEAYRLDDLVFTAENGKSIGVVALGRGKTAMFVALNAPECGDPKQRELPELGDLSVHAVMKSAEIHDPKTGASSVVSSGNAAPVAAPAVSTGNAARVLNRNPVVSPASPLTGKWDGGDGGYYYLHQVGDELYGYGESNQQVEIPMYADPESTEPAWATVLVGKITGGCVRGTWAQVPKGRDAGKHGRFTLAVVAGGNVLDVVHEFGGWGPKRLIRIAYIDRGNWAAPHAPRDRLPTAPPNACIRQY
jgi:hypothetical protein